MRISAKTDYAVRAAAELAAAELAAEAAGARPPQNGSPDDGPEGPAARAWVKTESVAAAQNMPLPFLLNILAELRTAGLVQSRRGVDGGYRLARPPAEITVADVIRAVDGPLANIAGARPEDIAYPGSAAALRDTWVALRATMRSVLESITLDQLVAGVLPDHVRGLLEGEDAWQARV